MSPLHTTTRDPVSLLRWRTRLSWRRAARRIVAEHVHELLSRLAEFRGLPVCGLTTTPAGTVRVVLPGWTISVAGVAPSAQASLTGAAQHPCRLSNAGRYGRFWWFAVDYQVPGALRRSTILGSRLVVAPIEDGHPPVEWPDLSPLVMAS
jgi:hypothetical protein